MKNPRQRARKLGVLRLDSLTKGISRPLKEVVKAYEYELSVLHPFEATLADLTVRARAKRGHSTLPEVLGAVNELRKEVLEVGKTYVGLAKNASTKAEAVQAAEDGIKAIEGLVLGVRGRGWVCACVFICVNRSGDAHRRRHLSLFARSPDALALFLCAHRKRR